MRMQKLYLKKESLVGEQGERKEEKKLLKHVKNS